MDIVKGEVPQRMLSEAFWKMYKEDFRVFKYFKSKKQDSTVKKFKKINPM